MKSVKYLFRSRLYFKYLLFLCFTIISKNAFSQNSVKIDFNDRVYELLGEWELELLSIIMDKKNSDRDSEGLLYVNNAINTCFDKFTDNDFIGSFDYNELYGYKASLLFDLGEYHQAIASFNAIENNSSLEFMQLLSRAKSYIEVNNLDMAIKDLDNLINNKRQYYDDYTFAIIFKLKAYCLNKLSRLSEAQLCINEALVLNRNDWEIWQTQVEIHFSNKDFNKANKTLTEAIMVVSNHNLYYLRGLVGLKLENNISACNDFKEAARKGNTAAKSIIFMECTN